MSAGRPLGGEAGYKRLVRLLARAFYSGECPPKEVDAEDVPAGARATRRDKVRPATGHEPPLAVAAVAACRQPIDRSSLSRCASHSPLPCSQNEYLGLGVLLLDLLAGAHGYVKDVVITGTLGVSGKVANRALRYLQAEGLLHSGAC